MEGGSGQAIARDFTASAPGAYALRATMSADGASVDATVRFTVYAGTGIAPPVQKTVEVNEPGKLAAAVPPPPPHAATTTVRAALIATALRFNIRSPPNTGHELPSCPLLRPGRPHRFTPSWREASSGSLRRD